MADSTTPTDVLGAFAAPSAPAAPARATYTPTHAAMTDGDATLQGVKRDSDGVPFVAVTRGKGDAAKTRYDRADRVARYLQLLAQAGG